jgi:hypothetical protein
LGKSFSFDLENFIASPPLSTTQAPGEEDSNRESSFPTGPQEGSRRKQLLGDLGDKPVVKKKKTQARIKLVARPQKLALGDDIMLPEVLDMEERVMVG